MNKRILVVCFLAMVAVSCMCWAGNPKDAAEATASASEERAFTGAEKYQRIKAYLDYLNDSLKALDLKFCDSRISPIVQAERCYEVPIEIGFFGPESKLVQAFEKMSAFSFADSRLAHGSISISVSAQTAMDGQALLTITVNQRLRCGDIGELGGIMSKRNEMITRAMASLLKLTTFNPQIKKKILAGDGKISFGPAQAGPGQNWITNLRIDNDNRVQMTGYGLGPDSTTVTQFGDDLLKSGSFVEVFLTNMNKNTYEKVPVWRFDFVARLR